MLFICKIHLTFIDFVIKPMLLVSAILMVHFNLIRIVRGFEVKVGVTAITYFDETKQLNVSQISSKNGVHNHVFGRKSVCHC